MVHMSLYVENGNMLVNMSQNTEKGKMLVDMSLYIEKWQRAGRHVLSDWKMVNVPGCYVLKH